MNRAETYAEQGQFRSALLEVKNAIQKDPNNVEHIVRLAHLYLQVGAAKEASELLSPWLKEKPDAVALTLARAYVEQGKHLSATETLALQTPDSPAEQLEATLIRAKALSESGEPAEALALYNNLLTSNPTDSDAIAGKLQAQIGQGMNAQAVETAKQWLAKNTKDPEVLYWEGRAQYNQNKLEQAAETLTEAVGVLPTSDVFLPIRRNVLIALSRVLTEQGKITEAQIYNQILSENANTGTREQAEAVVTALKDGNFDEAKSILKDMLKVNPDNQQAALMLGALYAGTGEEEEGAHLLSENLDPETTPTQFIRAATMAQIDTGEREAALKTLDRAIEARPKDNELLAMHGILALSLPGHEDEGISSLSKVLANEPDRVRLRLALARHYLKNNNREQALGQLRMAFTSSPSEWQTTGTYLNVLIQQGENQEASEIRDALINGYSNEPRAMLLASMADAQLGNTKKATQRLENLANNNPELPAPKIALASLYTQAGQQEKAIDALVSAASLIPNTINPLQLAGRIYAQDHSIAEVKTWLQSVAEKYPELQQNADTLTALIQIQNGDLASARKILTNWKDSDSGPVKRAYGQLLLAEARVAIKSQDWAEARAKAAEAITLEPGNLQFALLPVGIAELEGKMEDAFAALDAVEKSHGKVTATVLLRANLLKKQKGTEAAYSYLTEQWYKTKNLQLMPALLKLAKEESPASVDDLTKDWLQEAPESLAANMARAEWLMADNQNAAAVPLYEQILKRQPNNVAALNNLAWTLREADLKRAVKLAQKASELAPDNAAVLDTYGWVLHLSGNQEKAKSSIEKALSLTPGNAEIKAHLETVKKAL
jgi:tetratricopeptide (TPR) repeat protein